MEEIKSLVEAATHIVVVQADNPDADSLGSALALEHMLGDMDKQITLYCGVDIPTYLRYMPGWDRVVRDLPKQFDLAIIVDASTYTLFEQLEKTKQLAWLKSKPVIVLDHHAVVENRLDFAKASIIDGKYASTGQLLYELADKTGWPISKQTAEFLMTSILGDTQGLTNDLTSAETYRVMASLVEHGADRPMLEDLRREASKMVPEIYKYKARLISDTKFAADGAVAYVTVPQQDLNEFSPLYNPAALIQFDMLQIIGVKLAIVFKRYDNGKYTAAIRSTTQAPIAAKLADTMGGGGHPHASGFKIENCKSFGEAEKECLDRAAELLSELDGNQPSLA